MALGRVHASRRGLGRLPARPHCGQTAVLELPMRMRAPGRMALLGIQWKALPQRWIMKQSPCL